MALANGANVILAIKKQSGGLGAPETGSGATGIEVRPSTGLAQQVATIQSQMLNRQRFRDRPRQGSISTSAAYETELQLNALDLVYAAILGTTGAAVTAAFDIDNTDVTSLAISGSGTVGTVASGNLRTLGLRAGMQVTLTGMTNSANNGKSVGILAVPTATTITFEPGILTDETADTTFTMSVDKSWSTPAQYEENYYTVEEQFPDADISKYGSDMKFNSLNFGLQPNQMATVGFGLAGRKLEIKSAGDSPVLTDPTFPTTGESMVLLDGQLYRNGEPDTNLTGFTFGVQAAANFVPMLSDRYSPDVFVGMFDFTGQFTGIVRDDTEFQAFLDEDTISILLRLVDPSSAKVLSIYIGNASYGGNNMPLAEGAVIQTIPVYAGRDKRGGGYAQSTLVISQTT